VKHPHSHRISEREGIGLGKNGYLGAGGLTSLSALLNQILAALAM
jgi:hypothetical protein